MYVDSLNNQNLQGSIVNTGAIYPVHPVKKLQTPEIFAVVTSGTTIALANRNVVISGGCLSGDTPIEIPFFGIQGPISQVNCQSAVKKKVRLTCYERPCAENVYMGINIKRILNPFNQTVGEWTPMLAFPVSADEECIKTCAQKVAEFITYANKLPDIMVTFSAVSGQPTQMYIESKIAGDNFQLAGYEGFNTETIVTENRARVLYGEDLRGWGIDSCLAVTDCDPDICLNTLQFDALIPNRHDSNDNISGSNGNIGGSYYLMKKRIMLVWNGASTPAAITEFLSIVNGEKDPGDYLAVTLSPVYPTPPTPTPVAPTPVAPTPTA